MLRITIPESEGWDESKQRIVSMKEQTLQLEHSLVSLSKWESKWCKAFLSKQEKTYEETVDYIRCMTLTPNVKEEVYNFLTQENINQIKEYIEARQSATYIHNEDTNTINRETVTSELVYYWMIALGIPFECQKWHLNRLITLIKVCNLKNQKPKKTGSQELMRRNKRINAANRKRFNSKG